MLSALVILCDDLPMSYPPSGSHVPPPSSGSHDGQPPYGSPPGPGHGGPGGAGPKSGLSGGIIAGIVGVVVLVLAVCCMGGFFVYQATDDESESPSTSETNEEPTDDPTDDDPTEEPTEETTTDEPTDEPTSETSTPSDSSSSPTGTSVDFPASYDGWTNEAPSSTTLAIYSKDGDRISVIASTYIKPSNYEQLWESVTKYGEVSCGSSTGDGSDLRCTAEKNGSTFLATSSDLDEAELASAVQGMLDEL